jgi:hypothetical protein
MESSHNTTATAKAAVPLLGKRKDPPLPPPQTSSQSPTNIAVDAAFKRLFGYSWGTTFDLSTKNSAVSEPSLAEREMVEIFGASRTARILNLPWDVVGPKPTASMDEYYNPAAMLTTKIVATDATISTPAVSSSAAAMALQTDSTTTRRRKKMRLEDYKSIALPSHMVASSSTSTTHNAQGARALGSSSTAATTATTIQNRTTAPTTSNLDSVLSKIAGKKQLNTVEKSSNDWEGFKETDKTLQDELERNAQSKNAYLVKQDFLNRIDHRKFELEKEERDRERSRRAAESK